MKLFAATAIALVIGGSASAFDAERYDRDRQDTLRLMKEVTEIVEQAERSCHDLNLVRLMHEHYLAFMKSENLAVNPAAYHDRSAWALSLRIGRDAIYYHHLLNLDMINCIPEPYRSRGIAQEDALWERSRHSLENLPE